MDRFPFRLSVSPSASVVTLLLTTCMAPVLAAEQLDPAVIGNASGTTASVSDDGVVRIGWSRTDVEVTVDGMTLPPAAGLGSWAAFSGSNERAAIDGDFIMTGEEVQPVLRALRDGGLHVVALHNHMLGEQPGFYFTHYWGKGPAAALARAFRAALDAQAAASESQARAP